MLTSWFNSLDLPRALAIVRIALGVAAGLNVLEAHVHLSSILGGAIAVPVLGLGLTSSWMWFLTLVGGTAAVTLIAGVRTRASALTSAVVSALVLLSDQQTYSSHRQLITTLLVLLAFSGADQVWVLRRRSLRPAGQAHWFILLMLTQLSVVYLFAGLSKVNAAFLSGAPLGGWMRFDLPGVLLMSVAFGTVFGEVFLAFGLWFRRTRALAALIGVLLHASIVVFLEEGTLPLIAFACACVPLYLLHFVPRTQ